MDPRLTVIRLCLAFLASLLLLWLAPWWCWVPLALMMPAGLFSCTVSCARCSGSQAPCEFQVVISGVVNGSCSNCNNANGTFIVDIYVESGGTCTWEAVTALVCSIGSVNFRILNSGSDRVVWVYWTIAMSYWSKTYSGGDGGDCMTFSESSVPQVTVGAFCDNTASTCAVSVV